MTAPLPPKRALVTGASGELGSAIARRLAREGAHVIVHANSRLEAAEQLAAELCAAGHSAEAVAFDVTDRAAAHAAIDALLQAGPVQILVNNAGLHDDAVFPALREAQWQRVLDVSLNGFYHVTQPLMMPMIRTRWGRVINISSVAGVAGNRGQVNYAAAKGALNSATKALSLEVASRGITVNAVAPGIIQSPMADAVFDAATIAQLVPAKRAGTPEEVAALVAFLAGPEAGYITGQVLSINGGMV
ncbi:3-oxoacyl-ACP reductase FabG [Eleftheria terrae]|uniref:3-oxoacyl-ACP reductase FabG n=1 Tax=Eleftheria terrae TaxID=1597781 RepID=UPI00263B2E23|nr:3-oxoacyl-ACP reductase FabG [Eleftheria terrae]WKB54188.1 3-oxoacyl-ACP reductase FabG [Eleftheria terrae]